MDKKGKGIWWALGVLAALAVAVTVLYYTERRVRRLCHLIEERLRAKPIQMKVDL